jgi:hypothetical protein
MASRSTTLPFFPNPPKDYDQKYLAEIIRAFSTFMRQVQNPGEGRATTIVLTTLQQNDYGLEPGTIFVVNGQLRIPLINSPYVGGVGSVGSVGSVVVSTT